MNYIIITPVKDEAKYIKFTIESVIKQTLLPKKWIIVDDGSTDNTGKIVELYTKKYNWIILKTLTTYQEPRQGGSKVVSAFNFGYKLIENEDWDFIVKLDGDLILPDNYFEEIAKVFSSNQKVGIAGGIILNKVGDKFIQEGTIDYHIRGAFKSYRKECFFDIGGLKPIWYWDGIDEMQAMFKGWRTMCIDLKVKHLRPTSIAYNKKEHALKSGYEAYRIRMSIFLLLIRFFHRLIFEKPLFFYGVYYLIGYLIALFDRPEFIINKELAKFINKFHFNRIIKIFIRSKK